MLDQLLKDAKSGLARVLSGDEVKRLEGCPEAAFLVELKPGFMFGSQTGGPLVTDSTLRGMHGYLADRSEMNSTFLIAGPGVPAGRTLGEIDMRDIAPTLAGILAFACAKRRGAMYWSTKPVPAPRGKRVELFLQGLLCVARPPVRIKSLGD